jgi:hypothetical protein
VGAGVVGALVGGIFVDRIFAKTGRVCSRFTIIGIALLFSGAPLTAILAAPSLTTALISISLGVGFGFITGGSASGAAGAHPKAG